MDLWNSSNYDLKIVTFHPFFIGSKKRLYSCPWFSFSCTKQNSSLKFMTTEIVQVVLFFHLCFFTLGCRKEQPREWVWCHCGNLNCLQSQNLPLTLGWLRPTTARKQKFINLYIEEWHIPGFNTVLGEHSSVQCFPVVWAALTFPSGSVSKWMCPQLLTIRGISGMIHSSASGFDSRNSSSVPHCPGAFTHHSPVLGQNQTLRRGPGL